MAQNEYAVRLEHVTKTFGPVVANKDVSLGVRRGEILALLGENGSGKTTLMNMIAGIYFPDEGEIYVGDKAVTIRSPRDALDLGIGMIHQHFKLVDVFSATENIALSMGGGEKFDLKKVHDKARAICEKYEFNLDLDQKVYEMSVSQKQTLEIVKVLYRGADILILDEPTAVLTPQETEKLFSVIRNMKADGKAVIIITHKLHEVLSISDRVAILRKGDVCGRHCHQGRRRGQADRNDGGREGRAEHRPPRAGRPGQAAGHPAFDRAQRRGYHRAGRRLLPGLRR